MAATFFLLALGSTVAGMGEQNALPYALRTLAALHLAWLPMVSSGSRARRWQTTWSGQATGL